MTRLLALALMIFMVFAGAPADATVLANMSLDWHANTADLIVLGSVRVSGGKVSVDIERTFYGNKTKTIEVVADDTNVWGSERSHWTKMNGMRGYFFLVRNPGSMTPIYGVK